MILIGILSIIGGLVILINKVKINSQIQISDESYILLGVFSIIVGIFSLLHVIIYG